MTAPLIHIAPDGSTTHDVPFRRLCPTCETVMVPLIHIAPDGSTTHDVPFRRLCPTCETVMVPLPRIECAGCRARGWVR